MVTQFDVQNLIDFIRNAPAGQIQLSEIDVNLSFNTAQEIIQSSEYKQYFIVESDGIVSLNHEFLASGYSLLRKKPSLKLPLDQRENVNDDDRWDSSSVVTSEDTDSDLDSTQKSSPIQQLSAAARENEAILLASMGLLLQSQNSALRKQSEEIDPWDSSSSVSAEDDNEFLDSKVEVFSPSTAASMNVLRAQATCNTASSAPSPISNITPKSLDLPVVLQNHRSPFADGMDRAPETTSSPVVYSAPPIM